MKHLKHKFFSHIIPLLGLFGLLFALYSVLSFKPAEKRDPIVNPPINDYETNVAGIGIIEPKSELISLGVELPGIVRDVKVKVGDLVKKGDILFQLDQRDIDAEIKRLEESLKVAKVQALDSKTQFSLVQAIKDKRALSIDEFDRRRYAYDLAEAKVDEIEAEIFKAKTTKDRLNVTAPIDGQILEVNVRPGEYAPAGMNENPLIRMGDVSTLHVRVDIDEENSKEISPSSSAYGFKRGDTKNKVPLSFVRFEPYIKPKQNLAVAGQRVDTRVLQVIYALPHEDAGFFVGQQMDVFIEKK